MDGFLPTLAAGVSQGGLETVWPKEAAKKKYVFPVPKWKERK